ncbi:MAG: hypothetical protein GEU74_14065 [Nitriliruptorales bacterium]|nr:hypothetical protein [Nitriliruptorales bacterium]
MTDTLVPPDSSETAGPSPVEATMPVPPQRRLLPVVTAPPVEDNELFDAFRTATERTRSTGRLVFGTSVNVRALGELLVEKGIITQEEFDASRVDAVEAVQEQFVDAGAGVKLAADVVDKYEIPPEVLPQIDCAARIPVCKAACCSMRWALTEQDIMEGVVQWDLHDPYANRIGSDGWCAHCDAGTKGCTIYEARPAVCRTYDCSKDDRIWSDFENMVINPELFDEDGRIRKPMQGEQRG